MLLVGAAAQADETSIGIGTGADRGKTDCVAAYACNHSDVVGKLTASYGFANGFELQALAFDAGRFQGGDTTPLGTPFGGRFKVSGVGVTAGFRWRFAPQWSLLGQAGLARVRTRFDYAAPFSGEVSETVTRPLIGASVAYDIAPHWRLSLDVNATRFKVYTTNGSLQLFGASAHYVF
jgi:hypothetical protein